jgi:hypothetical protein
MPGPGIEQILRTRKMVEVARTEAQELVEEARSAGTLEILDERDGLAVQEAGPFTRLEFFPGLGYQNRAVGAAFGLAEGEIGDPVVTENNVFLIKSLERFPADSLAWQEQKEMQRAQAMFTAQQQRLGQWISKDCGKPPRSWTAGTRCSGRLRSLSAALPMF